MGEMMLDKQGSEVRRLLTQISSEYEAAQRGLIGFAAGSSQHAFITARLEHMSQLHIALRGLVGDAAMPMIAEQLNAIPDPTSSLTQPSS
jgi:hypothetical protein